MIKLYILTSRHLLNIHNTNQREFFRENLLVCLRWNLNQFMMGPEGPGSGCFELQAVSGCVRAYTPSAALAAAEATRGSTTEARKATVDMTGFPCRLKGTGWNASGPSDASLMYSSSMGSLRKWRMHSSCVRVPTCWATLFQSSRCSSKA